MSKIKIILASDHAGFKIKEAVKSFLQSGDCPVKCEVLDVGAHEYIESDDYPSYMVQAGMKVAEDMKGDTKAILFGGSGQGEAIVVNRFPGVRAVVWYGGPMDIIKLSREHNDANILSIGARFVNEDTAREAVATWLTTSFSGEERHVRRIGQIDNIE